MEQKHIPGLGKEPILNAIQKFDDLKKMPFISEDEPLLALFDSLQPSSSDDILGKWRGGGFATGHWLLSALADMRWHGKWFVSERDVKPLICFNDDDSLYSNLALNGEASLRMMSFRDRVSASIVYDGVPVFGHLRRIDESTLLGIVDGKTLLGREIVDAGRHQIFYLERVEEWGYPLMS
ncbi:DUF4334 domain-containing protein [Rhizobium leguminosarum]|nr:DUF4334 domain-containing protein [Rhizobium leguminosarum]TBG07007.1 DUF4334 domain-containing protein [Rhizobium leguminosarum]TBG07880.1 DUF4334 domain-containing protein [Rhizobium leguminosarum]TBG30044.1 DUF4334 domain-containing protein [Rhizobium leguminosarum]TBG50181.1 DUF4334 domain-containing protein [Rhizobium leguminosarum]